MDTKTGMNSPVNRYLLSNKITLVILIQVALSSSIFPNNLKIYNEENLIWKEDFQSGELIDWDIMDDLENEKSNWYIKDGYLIQDTDIGDKSELTGTNIIYNGSQWEDHVIRVNLVCTDDDYIGILFWYQDNDNYYRLILSSEQKQIRIDKKFRGDLSNLALINEEWEYTKFTATIFLNNEKIKIFLNDKQYFDLNVKQFQPGKVGFTSISNLGSFFDDIAVYSDYKIKSQEALLSFTRGPYLQNVLGDSAVIMWDTSLPSNSVVEYGTGIEQTDRFIDNTLTVKHEIKLKLLDPGTVYYYRINSAELTSDWYSFKTSPKENKPFSFIVYGDNQMNFLRHSKIAEQFSKHEFDFIISCGDVVQNGNRDDWDVEFFNPLKNILSTKAIYAAIGNHELNSENYYKNFSNPDLHHESYYSFKYGNSFFIIVDNPKAGYPEKEYYTDFTFGSPQYIWLEKELSSDIAQRAEWLFVINHIPVYVNGSQDYFPLNKEYLVPLFEKYGVDFSFSGHVHGYERSIVNGINYIITAGGGGAQNKKNVSELKQAPSFKLTYNFCRIDIDGNNLTLSVFNDENELIDELKLRP